MNTTQMVLARENKITPEMEKVSKIEEVDISYLITEVSNGRAIIPKNKLRGVSKPCIIGRKFSVKVNANVGTSPQRCDLEEEKRKVKVALEAGADCIMDLSIAGDLSFIRRTLLEICPVPFGTVPIYEVAYDMERKGKAISDITISDVLSVLEKQAKEGVDFFTIHAGLTLRAVNRYVEKRVMKIVSRGGSIIAEWIAKNNKENLLYEYFDEILDILAEYDVAISLGDGLRPGGIPDATDRAQIDELIILGELTERAYEKGVQVMIEGPGHIPLDQIEANMILEQRLCNDAPFYVLGPLPVDIAVGFDHIAGAIGGALAGWKGASMLCYVTPAEHISHPTVEDVYLGVVGTKIAASCADLAKGLPKAVKWNRQMSEARYNLDWERQIELAIQPKVARCLRERFPFSDEQTCTMCGDFCAVRRMHLVNKKDDKSKN